MTTQTLTLTRIHKLESAARIPALAQLLVLIAVQLTAWSNHSRTRNRLRELDAHMLDDIGISEAQARKEADKRFWQR